MVQRQSEAIRLQQQSAPAISQAAPGTARFRTESGGTSRTLEFDDGRSRLLSNLLQTGERLVGMAMERDAQEAYLNGAAAVGQGKSEEELEASPLTRNWAVAGFRDTAGRLKLAESEAQLAQDMSILREQGPEAMRQYLANRRPALLDATSGMSYEARTNALGNMLLSDEAAQKRHTVEHRKFIIEKANTAIGGQVRTAFSNLSAARVSLDAEWYHREMRSAAGVLHTAIWDNPNLPHELKQKHTVEFLQHALATDNVTFFEQLRDTALPDPNGGTSSVFDRLPFSEQEPLSNKYREALKRNAGLRHIEWTDQYTQYEAAIAAEQFEGGAEALRTFLLQGQVRGAWGQEKADSLMLSYYKFRHKNDNLRAMSAAAMQGDVRTLHALEADDTKAVEAIEKVAVQDGLSPMDTVGALTQAGMRGNRAAYAAAGARTAPAFRALSGQDGKIDPGARDMVNAVFSSLEQAQQSGRATAFVEFMAGMPEDVQLRVERLRNFMNTDKSSVEEALARVLSIEAAEAKLSNADRLAMQGKASTRRSEIIASLSQPRGLAMTAWLKLGKFFSPAGESAAELGRPLETPVPFVTAGAREVRSQQEQFSLAVTEEFSELGRVYPLNDPSEMQSTVLGRVLQRTVPTSSGALILPKGASPAQFFGLQERASPEIVGRAIDSIIEQQLADKAKVDSRVLRAVNGRVQFSAYDEDDVPIVSFEISPEMVGAALQDEFSNAMVLQSEKLGEGITIEQGGVSLNFNGVNSAAVDEGWMLKLRKFLVQNEGVRAVPYDDATGKPVPAGQKPKGTLTVGVGVTQDFFPPVEPDGTVSPENIRDSFLRASNHAADAGRKIADRAGLNSEAGFLLAAELTYHAGPGHVSPKQDDGAYVRMYAAIRTAAERGGGAELAIQEFRKTKAWRVSGSSRRKHYEALIQQAAR